MSRTPDLEAAHGGCASTAGPPDHRSIPRSDAEPVPRYASQASGTRRTWRRATAGVSRLWPRNLQRPGLWLAAVGGALWCSSYAWPLVDPRSLEHVLRGDWAQHTLGWLFFRREPPALPLGSLRSFLHPVGTTLGYMDAIPWVALMLRPWSAWLPADFQYLGLWVVLCSAALAYAAARIAARTTPHWEQQAMVGVLFAASPTLLERLIHPALCAHALILVAIALGCTSATSKAQAQRALALGFALLTFSVATHPYLAAMVLVLIVALPWQLRIQLGRRAAVLAGLALPAWTAAELALFGYFEGGVQTAARGFGAYSANLNTFWNSMGLSRLLPALPHAQLQYEGYCYLGAGSFFLCAVALLLVSIPRTRRWLGGAGLRRAAWPIAACFALAMFALASPVYWGEHELLRIPGYADVPWLGHTFRASGRFIWPLAYLINLGASLALLRGLAFHRTLASCCLLVALGLQLYDIDTSRAAWLFSKTRTHVLTAPEWSLADTDFRHLVLFPAEIESACQGPLGYRDEKVSELAYLAYRHGWTFNSGYAARLRPQTRAYCDELAAQIQHGQLDARSLYVVWRSNVRQMRKHGATCGRIDRTTVCVLARRHPFARHLAAHPP